MRTRFGHHFFGGSKPFWIPRSWQVIKLSSQKDWHVAPDAYHCWLRYHTDAADAFAQEGHKNWAKACLEPMCTQRAMQAFQDKHSIVCKLQLGASLCFCQAIAEKWQLAMPCHLWQLRCLSAYRWTVAAVAAAAVSAVFRPADTAAANQHRQPRVIGPTPADTPVGGDGEKARREASKTNRRLKHQRKRAAWPAAATGNGMENTNYEHYSWEASLWKKFWDLEAQAVAGDMDTADGHAPKEEQGSGRLQEGLHRIYASMQERLRGPD